MVREPRIAAQLVLGSGGAAKDFLTAHSHRGPEIFASTVDNGLVQLVGVCMNVDGVSVDVVYRGVRAVVHDVVLPLRQAVVVDPLGHADLDEVPVAVHVDFVVVRESGQQPRILVGFVRNAVIAVPKFVAVFVHGVPVIMLPDRHAFKWLVNGGGLWQSATQMNVRLSSVKSQYVSRHKSISMQITGEDI